MIKLIDSLVLSNYFVQFILLILLGGILIISYLKKGNIDRKKGILFFGLLVFLILILNVSESYRFFFGGVEGTTVFFVKVLSPFAALFLIFILYKLWNRLNKKIVGFLFVDVIILTVVEFVGIPFYPNFERIIFVFLTFIATFLLFLLVMDFLIRIPIAGGKAKKRRK